MSGSDAASQDDLVRLNDAATALGVSTQTIKKYCRCGLLRCTRLPLGHWRVYRTSLETLKQHETGENGRPLLP
jgi:predicted site-specific integrase-resolvase